MKHTKTPWKISATGGLIVPDNDNPISTICRGFGRDDDDFPNWEANARRIVACVNACEGMKTEELEQMYGGVWRDIFVDSLDKDVLIDELKAKNIRLLETLEWTVENLQEASALTDNEGADYEEVYAAVINAAHAAIAEAEKTPEQ